VERSTAKIQGMYLGQLQLFAAIYFYGNIGSTEVPSMREVHVLGKFLPDPFTFMQVFQHKEHSKYQNKVLFS